MLPTILSSLSASNNTYYTTRSSKEVVYIVAYLTDPRYKKFPYLGICEDKNGKQIKRHYNAQGISMLGCRPNRDIVFVVTNERLRALILHEASSGLLFETLSAGLPK